MNKLIDRLKEKDKLVGLCRLLDVQVISDEIEDYVSGYTLDSFKRKGMKNLMS